MQCCSQSQPVFAVNYIYLVRPKNLSAYVSLDNYVGSVASEGPPHVNLHLLCSRSLAVVSRMLA